MSWGILLDGDDRQHANAAVRAILAALADRAVKRCDLNGAAGLACLFAYAGDERHTHRGAEHLDAATAALETSIAATGLWSGIAGVRFAIAHLADAGDAAVVLAAIDRALLEALAIERWNASYDLIGGLCGIGVAALESGRTADAIALRVLDHLEALAERHPHGVTWFTPPERLPAWQRERCPSGHHNLGLAHGVPGVIALLARYLELGLAVERARPLLRAAVAWLLAAVPTRTPRRFPPWLGEVDTTAARLAWCYGDPGVTIALLRAARALSDSAIEAEARTLARAMATCSLDDAGVADTGLCHGAAGLAHVLNRLYQATGDAIVGDAARRWFARLLAMRRPGDGLAGFRTLRIVDGTDAWIEDASLLTGVTGVALALLAATTELEPRWDCVLACDVAPLESA